MHIPKYNQERARIIASSQGGLAKLPINSFSARGADGACFRELILWAIIVICEHKASRDCGLVYGADCS